MTDWPVNQPGDTIKLATPVDILCSYHYFDTANMATVASWGTRIIGDSGAYSAMSAGVPIDRENFHAWAAKWRNDLYWIAALDVIGDAEGTHENWLAAQRDGLNLVPTVHYGEPTSAMDRYAEEGATLIGLGGMVPYKSEPDRLMRWCLAMHRHARDHHPHVRFHGWGATHSTLVDSLPWWSVDSSGFSSAFRFGTMKLFDPRVGRSRSIPMDGRSMAKWHSVLKRYYGVDWRTVATSNAANRREVARVALRAVQLHGEWLQRRRQVSPPALLDGPPSGPLIHAALGRAASAQSEGITPDGRAISVKDGEVTNRGPLVAADADTAFQPLNPTYAPGSAEPRSTPRAGPRLHAALGAPAMQPYRSLDPDDKQVPAP